MSNLVQSVATQLGKQIREVEKKVDRRAASTGLTFWRADKDNDGDFDPLTAAEWESGAPVSTGVIDWASAFGVDEKAKVILAWVSGAISFRASASAGYAWVTTGEQRLIPVANDGTSYWSDVSGAVTVRVLGWWA